MKYLITLAIVALFATFGFSQTDSSYIFDKGGWLEVADHPDSTANFLDFDPTKKSPTAYNKLDGGLYVFNPSDSSYEAIILEPIQDATAPSGTVEPRHVGQLYIDTVGVDSIYMSTGLNDGDWQLISD